MSFERFAGWFCWIRWAGTQPNLGNRIRNRHTRDPVRNDLERFLSSPCDALCFFGTRTSNPFILKESIDTSLSFFLFFGRTIELSFLVHYGSMKHLFHRIKWLVATLSLFFFFVKISFPFRTFGFCEKHPFLLFNSRYLFCKREAWDLGVMIKGIMTGMKWSRL